MNLFARLTFIPLFFALTCACVSSAFAAPVSSSFRCLVTAMKNTVPLPYEGSRLQKLGRELKSILPPEYIKALETLGPVQKSLVKMEGNKIMLLVGAGDNEVALKLTLEVLRAEPDVLIVDRLTLRDLLADSSRLHLGQKKKGLPQSVFNHAKRELLDSARALGFKRIKAPAAQNFSVNSLYLKSIGMKPATEKAEAFQDFIAKAFQASRKLPPEIRVNSLDAFSRATTGVPEAVLHDWDFYQAHPVPEMGIEVLPVDQKPLFFIDHNQPKGKQLYVLREIKKGVYDVFDWNENAQDPERALVRDLTEPKP